MGATDLQGAIARMSEEPRPTEDEVTEPTEELEETQEEVQEEEVETTEEEDEAETSDDDDTEAGESYEVEEDGETKTFDTEEQKLGYLRERDYRHKMAQIAEQRKTLEQKHETLDAHIKEVETLLDDEGEWFSSAEAKEFRRDYPDEYFDREDAYKAKKDRLAKAKTEKDKSFKERQQQRVAEELEAARQKVPEWRDQAVASKEVSAANQYLIDTGYTQKEIDDAIDHRLFVLARKASKFDQLSDVDLSKKTVKKPPKSLKPGAKKVNTQNRAREDAKSTLKKTGKLQDALKALKL